MKKKNTEEKIFLFLGKLFAMLLLSSSFVLIFIYGLQHATTLN